MRPRRHGTLLRGPSTSPLDAHDVQCLVPLSAIIRLHETPMKSLPPPDDAVNDDQAVEVLRGWIIGGDLQVSVAFEALGNQPEFWGQLLAETAVHVADAMSAEGYGNKEAIFAKLQASLLKNLERPDPGLHGTVRHPTQ